MPTATELQTVPEIGPSLGRLTEAPDPARRGALGVPLDDLRLELVTRLFELAGGSREFVAAGDVDGALLSLGRVAWVGAWEQTVSAVAARLTEAANTGLQLAAAESRLPSSRLQRLLLTPDDTLAIAARLGAGAASLIAALDVMDRLATRPTWRAWHDVVGAAARRLESAWIALESAAMEEQTRWHLAIERVRRWRRPAWPLRLVATVVLVAATYLGLTLGGYLSVPSPLQGLAELWWSRPWN